MKRTVLTILFLFTGFGLILSNHIPDLQAKTFQLTYSNFFPPSHVQSKLAEAWGKEIQKQTNDQVEIIYYPGQTLTKAAQVYDGVVTGRSDIGMSCLLYTRGRFPLMDVINLPFGNPNGQFAPAVFNEIYDVFQPKELADVKVLYLHAHGPGFIHTKDTAIHTMCDLKGLKIRSPGSVAEMLKALGATPASMPMPEVYQALQRGVVDGAVYPEETNKGWKIGEVIDYTIANYSTAYSVGFFAVMNKDKWNQLPQDIQKTIEKINTQWAQKTGEAWDRSDYEGVQFSLRQGNSILGIKPDEAGEWKEAVQPVFERYIDKTEKKDLPGEDVLNFLKEKLQEYKKGQFESDYME
jgi:TRAP-type C4-dicarboxylate transport system substrate-binding protein